MRLEVIIAEATDGLGLTWFPTISSYRIGLPLGIVRKLCHQASMRYIPCTWSLSLDVTLMTLSCFLASCMECRSQNGAFFTPATLPYSQNTPCPNVVQHFFLCIPNGIWKQVVSPCIYSIQSLSFVLLLYTLHNPLLLQHNAYSTLKDHRSSHHLGWGIPYIISSCAWGEVKYACKCV